LGVGPLFAKNKTNDSSQLSIDEPFDAIRRSLQSAGKSPPRFIGFTGCYAGEGASTVAANVSKSIASYNDAKVLLVDLNFEAPSLKSRLGLPYASGAAEKSVMKLPTPDHSALQVAPDVAPGVDVLPAGFKNLNPLKLGQSERFAAALAEGKKQYDYVIFDIPPMAQSPMAIEFAKFFDGVVMVVESGRVRRQVAQQAVEKMSRSGVTVFGVVMNKRKFYMPQWVYDRL
jgi:Mrp family chromosome partitioning ATPase